MGARQILSVLLLPCCPAGTFGFLGERYVCCFFFLFFLPRYIYRFCAVGLSRFFYVLLLLSSLALKTLLSQTHLFNSFAACLPPHSSGRPADFVVSSMPSLVETMESFLVFRLAQECRRRNARAPLLYFVPVCCHGSFLRFTFSRVVAVLTGVRIVILWVCLQISRSSSASQWPCWTSARSTSCRSTSTPPWSELLLVVAGQRRALVGRIVGVLWGASALSCRRGGSSPTQSLLCVGLLYGKTMLFCFCPFFFSRE